MQKRLKILVSAYACGPNHGSEPGLGWNFVLGLSEYHEVHVISEKLKWEPEIKAKLKELPSLNKNIKFYFIEKQRNKKLRKLWPPSYYWFYKKWQKEAYKLAIKLDDLENFDIIHQLNMVGYREPGYLWKINKPFTWGPIGGLENSPWRFLPSLGLKGLIFYSGRNFYNIIQRNFSKRPRLAAQRKNNYLIAATPTNQDLIKKIWGVNSQIICEVGQEINKTEIIPNERLLKEEPLKIVWSGQHIPRKNLALLLNALKYVNFPFELHILGIGEMTKKWINLAENLGVNSSCHWHGWLEKEKAIEIMSKGHVFSITSVSDLTSTVTLEALSYGVPIVCLDHCGFAHVVTDDCGIRIPLNSPKMAAKNIALALEKLYSNENYRQKLSKGAIKRSSEFSWNKKIEQLNSIYKSMI